MTADFANICLFGPTVQLVLCNSRVHVSQKKIKKRQATAKQKISAFVGIFSAAISLFNKCKLAPMFFFLFNFVKINFPFLCISKLAFKRFSFHFLQFLILMEIFANSICTFSAAVVCVAAKSNRPSRMHIGSSAFYLAYYTQMLSHARRCTFKMQLNQLACKLNFGCRNNLNFY